MECIGPKWRSTLGMIYGVGTTIVMLVTIAVAYAWKNNYKFQLTISGLLALAMLPYL
jgi:hypothetical protein